MDETFWVQVNFRAAFMYVAGYCSKSERGLAEGVKAAEAALPGNATARQRGRAIARAFIKCRLISAQEAIHNLLGLFIVPSV